MTVASSTSKSGPYAGNGATTVFAFNFKVQQAADIKVVRTVTSNGTQLDTTLAAGADYTVAVNGDQSASPGGNVTMTSAPAVGQQITILRNIAATQGASIQNQGAFYPKVLENAFDKLTMLVQQLSEESARALKLSVADSITNLQDLLVRLNDAVGDAETAASGASGDAATAVAAAASAGGSASAAATSAAQAQAAADSISGGPVTSVNGMTGVVVGLASVADAQTLQNKTLQDATTFIADEADPTKKAKFQAAGIATGTTRTYTLPDEDMTLAGRGANAYSGKQEGTQVAMANYIDKVGTPSATSGAITLNLQDGDIFDLPLSGNVTSMVLSNVPTLAATEEFTLVVRVSQGATAYTLAWFTVASWLTAGGTAPAAPAANKTIEYVFTKRGTNGWIGRKGAAN